VATPLSSKPERFQQLQKVYLLGRGQGPGSEVPLEVESVWGHRGGLIFKFHGVDSMSDAERFAGSEVRIPIEERAALEPDEYYQSDLTGCRVFDRPTGALLGCVTGWQDGGGAGLLEVEPQAGGETLLIPFARAICVEIDVPGKRIAVELPEGLRDLNSR
jgi:16S rRNA processing protein RimM